MELQEQTTTNRLNLADENPAILEHVAEKAQQDDSAVEKIAPEELTGLHDLVGQEAPKETIKKKKQYDNVIERFFGDADYRNISIGSINAVLHGLATVSSFLPEEGPMKALRPFYKLVDKLAFTCTRWIAPITSYGFSAYSAFKNKEGIKAIIKLIPPSFLPLVSDANIDAAYGSSLGFNQPYDLAEERIKALCGDDKELQEGVKEMNKSFSGNMKLMFGVLKQMVTEFFKGNMPKEEGIFFMNCVMLLGGSFPIMLFARNARNTGFAKATGLIRNLGGILGDIGLFWFDRKNMHKFLISIMCGVSQFSSIVKRWVSSESVARTLIHLSAALDVSAYALWNAFNDKSQHSESTKKIDVSKPHLVRTRENLRRLVQEHKATTLAA